MPEVLEMSKKELDRLTILNKVIDGLLTQKQAAQFLKLKSDRQVRNLLTSYKKYGAEGLISKHRGKRSNRSFDSKFKSRVMALIKEKYPDFSPTFASEKLNEYHGIVLSRETLRKWLIAEHLWISKKKHNRVYSLRPRRDCFGELIQIDASHHHWFEDRADKCALIVFIDDATGRLTSLLFWKSECLEAYFAAIENHIKKHGRPRSIYSDRHAIFGGSDRVHHAQFIRAMKELDIENILAKSPQAKGRVERVNQTLQDRLIKEMRLRNISTIEDANRYLPEFIEDFNKKFSKEPRGQFDAHRPLDSGCDLKRILARCEERTVLNDLSISYNNKYYQILEEGMNNRLKGKKVEVRQLSDKSLKIFIGNKELRYLPIDEYIDERRIVGVKEKIVWMPRREHYKPGAKHPWIKYAYQDALRAKIKHLDRMV